MFSNDFEQENIPIDFNIYWEEVFNSKIDNEEFKDHNSEIDLSIYSQKNTFSNNGISHDQNHSEINKINGISTEITNYDEKLFLNNSNKAIKKLLNKKNKVSNKYFFSDNYIRKNSKDLIIGNIIDFINNQIKNIYKNIGHGWCTKQFLPLNKDRKSNNSAEFNKKFLNKTLREIFNEEISQKYTHYSKDHNKKLVEFLTNDINESSEYFKRLFNLNFSECLEYFNGKNKNIEELKGMNTFEKIKIKLEEKVENKDYLFYLNHYITNFIDIVNSKRERTPKKIRNK